VLFSDAFYFVTLQVMIFGESLPKGRWKKHLGIVFGSERSTSMIIVTFGIVFFNEIKYK